MVVPLLQDVRVLDFTELLPGPYATRLLALFGAEVIKVERPDGGDRARTMRPTMFEAANLGKKSATIDAKAESGRAAIIALAQSSDVLIEGYRPGVMERLGIGYVELKAYAPELIYVSLSGYGATGPYRSRPGHDYNYLAMAGAVLPDEQEVTQPPSPPVIPMADLGGSLFSVIAILMGLIAKRSSGSADLPHLDIGLVDCVMALMEPRVAEYQEQRGSGARLMERPAYGIFETRDHGFVSVGALEDHFWSRLVAALNLDCDDSDALVTYRARKENFAAVDSRLRGEIAKYSRNEIVSLLTEWDVPVAPVNSIDEALTDPHFAARGMVQEDAPGGRGSNLIGVPPALRAMAADAQDLRAPELGQHTREVLASVGL